MIITAYVKITIYSFAAISSMQLLLNMKSSRPLILPVAVITFFLDITMSSNINERIYVGIHIFPTYLWAPLVIILPGILLIVTLIRNKLVKTSK